MNNYNFPSTFFPTIEKIFPIILFTSLIFGLLYIIIGISLLVVNWKIRNAERISFGKRMLLKGIVRSVLAGIFFFLLSLAESFFGLSITSTHIPVIGDPNSPDTGFPVEDLKIISRKQNADDPTLCDITVLNTNPTYSAANLSVMVDGSENIGTFGKDHIAPGKTDETSVDGGSNTKSPCNESVIIENAGIAKN